MPIKKEKLIGWINQKNEPQCAFPSPYLPPPPHPSQGSTHTHSQRISPFKVLPSFRNGVRNPLTWLINPLQWLPGVIPDFHQVKTPEESWSDPFSIHRSTIGPPIFRWPSPISLWHHGVNLIFELHVILGLTNPFVQIRNHRIESTPLEPVSRYTSFPNPWSQCQGRRWYPESEGIIASTDWLEGVGRNNGGSRWPIVFVILRAHGKWTLFWILTEGGLMTEGNGPSHGYRRSIIWIP